MQQEEKKGKEKDKLTRKEIKDRIFEIHPDRKPDVTPEELEELKRLTKLLSEKSKSFNRKIYDVMKRRIEYKENKLREIIKQIDEDRYRCDLCLGTGKELKSLCKKCSGEGLSMKVNKLDSGIVLNSLEICNECYGIKFEISEKECIHCRGSGSTF